MVLPKLSQYMLCGKMTVFYPKDSSLRRSPKSIGYITKEPQMSPPNFGLIRPVDVKIFLQINADFDLLLKAHTVQCEEKNYQ